MEYRAEVDLEYEDFVNFNKAYRKKVAGKATKIVAVILYVVLAFGVLEIVAAAVMGFFDEYMIFFGALLFAVLVVTLLRNRISGKMSQKLHTKNAGTTHVLLGEEHAYFADKQKTVSYNYSAFKKIIRDSTAIYLFVDDRRAEIIPVRCIVDASAEDVCAFLFKKTGTYVINV